jgi:hypothetical protein
MSTEYYITKSLSWEATWTDVLYDFGVFLGSIALGMILYLLIVRCPSHPLTLPREIRVKRSHSIACTEFDAFQGLALSWRELPFFTRPLAPWPVVLQPSAGTAGATARAAWDLIML